MLSASPPLPPPCRQRVPTHFSDRFPRTRQRARMIRPRRVQSRRKLASPKLRPPAFPAIQPRSMVFDRSPAIPALPVSAVRQKQILSQVPEPKRAQPQRTPPTRLPHRGLCTMLIHAAGQLRESRVLEFCPLAQAPPPSVPAP